ncbi:hypothetical protein OI70_19045 [Dickeya fangzhongdai]|uniref:DUF3742 family protein n=1 Tax=Dickeya fangzhongdai TaxID=1778540 RepID=UPI000574D171|nr:DUF3742 family protein [Dickeya fangzhongdai]KHN52942.1 hypothetical protein OI70_19045 [Dickeya fangzhongdai]
MNMTTHSSTARFGQWLGRKWRAYIRNERQVAEWLAVKGMSPGVTTAVLWVVKLLVFTILLYAAFWLAVVLIGVAVLAFVSSNIGFDHEDDWPIGEQADHKKNPGYDPNMYSDAPDHRFYDSRYDD